METSKVVDIVDAVMEETVEEVKEEAANEVTVSQTVSNQKEEEKEKEASEEEEADDEVEEDEDPATLEDLFESLDDLQTPGSTCTGGVASVLPVAPGLSVKGVGIVPLPVTETTAAALKAVAQQAPHGKGAATIVDRNVRDTLQINADQVSLTHPSWNASLEKLVHSAVTELGVSPSMVQTHLYKLLLYETGGFFQKHSDTEKEDGMFATLVIQLPSIFEGGSFVVSHNGKSKTFQLDNSATASYSCHYVAHYADCEHEVLPVTSGYRLALVYSLCCKGTDHTPSARDLESAGRMVTAMERLPNDHSLFAIPLDHQYTTKSLVGLGVGALKGMDRAFANTISRVDGWKVIIAQLQRTDQESGGNDRWGGFEMEDSEKGDPEFDSLYNADGSDADVHKAWIRNQLDLSSVEDGGMPLACEDVIGEMWEEHFAGAVEYTGNAGASREVTYTTCV